MDFLGLYVLSTDASTIYSTDANKINVLMKIAFPVIYGKYICSATISGVHSVTTIAAIIDIRIALMYVVFIWNMVAYIYMIPKKIHYVWVGGKELPEMAKRCLNSWKEKLPDFEIVRWDETNSPMTHPFVKAMHDKKMWAFVSDYIRFYVLEKEGGVYLDMDTLVLKYFDTELMQGTFLGYTPDGFIGCGVIGAMAHDSFIQNILAYYDSESKVLTQEETSPHIVTKIFKETHPNHVRIYDASYFNPCEDGEKRTPEKLKNAYADNLWAESWVPFRRVRKFLRRIGIMTILKKLFRRLEV